MVAKLLGLKLGVLANGFRRGPLQLFGLIVGLVYGFGVAIVAAFGLVSLREADAEVARSIVVTLGSLGVLGFLFVPVVFGADDAMSPRRFSTFGIPTGKLAIGLAAAAFISSSTVALALVGAAQVITWNRSAPAVFVAIVCAILLIVTGILSTRVMATVATFLFASRRARELSGLLSLALLAAIVPILAVIVTVDWKKEGIAVLQGVSDVLAYTPLGAVWAAPGFAAVGNTAAAIGALVIAIAFVLALWLVWRLLVSKAVASPGPETKTHSNGNLGWFTALPATPVGVVAARSLSYWGRDARYRSALSVVPIVPILMGGAFFIAGTPLNVLMLIPVPVMCLFLAWSTVHNDVAFDNTAIWLHLAANIGGRADRAGRLVPPLLIGSLIIVVGVPLSAWGYGSAGVVAGLLGVSVCVLFAGLGISSIVSAGFPYPAVHPGDSPFAQPQSGAGGAAWVQGLSLLAILVASAPTVCFAVLGIVHGGAWSVLALLFGIATGVGALIGGVIIGGRVFDAHGPELLSFTERY